MRNRFPAFLICITLCFALANCKKADYLRVAPGNGIVLPAVTALAWLAAEAGGEKFASISDDGLARVWDMYRGSLFPAFPAEEDFPFELSSGVFFSYSETENTSPVFSPDGTKKIFPGPDGAICLADTATERVLARYYGIGSDEWLSLVPEGFYNASFGGSSCLTVERGGKSYTLEQLSGAFYRPDLFRSHVNLDFSSAPFKKFFKKAYSREPPNLFLVAGEGEIKIKLSERKGGIGLLALYRKGEKGDDIPSGLFNAENAAEKKYKEKGKTCYEITLAAGPGELGVSAFNKFNMIESERVWITILQSEPQGIAEDRAGLKVLLAANEFKDEAALLGEQLLLQADSSLYSSVEVKTSFAEEFTKDGFVSKAADLFKAANKKDVLALYIQGQGRADSFGNFSIALDRKNEIYAEDILQYFLNDSPNSILLMDVSSESHELETALLRLRQRLGNRAMFVFSSGSCNFEASLLSAVAKNLNPDFTGPVKSRYVHVTELIESFPKGAMVFLPPEDFRIADFLVSSGELRFQTMTSGMLKIDQADKNPLPLYFGETITRILPEGRYIIDMVYRNGYRETRTVTLRKKASTWVTFNYTPPLLAGDFSQLRNFSGGLQISELNPVNYERINREAMEGMGMAPYYVAYLSGEKLYRDGKYDNAIAEYSRSISLKNNYAEAYASRGNAHRRKGDTSRAIEDYDRAIRLKNNYPEVYNYRGYLYARRGELSRAIADFTQAIRYKADYTDAYFNRAYAYGEQGNWDNCIADYTQVIRLEPSNASAYYQRGSALLEKGDGVRAGADFDTAEKLKR